MKLIVLILCCFINSSIASIWDYNQDIDPISDEKSSTASGYSFNYDGMRDYSIYFRCSENKKLVFTINTDSYIGVEGTKFKFIYRVDKKEPHTIEMLAFSKTSGLYLPDASKIALDILGGNSIFVQAQTPRNGYHQTKISLSGSDKTIKKVFRDCGIDPVKIIKKYYTQDEFNTELQKFNTKMKNLPAEKQRSVIDTISKDFTLDALNKLISKLSKKRRHEVLVMLNDKLDENK